MPGFRETRRLLLGVPLSPRTLGLCCPFSRSKIPSFCPPPGLSHFSTSKNVSAPQKHCLHCPLSGVGPRRFGCQPLRSSTALTLVTEEAPQFSEDQPHHEHLGGPRGPSAAGAAARGPPTRRWLSGSEEKPIETAPRGHWLTQKPRPAAPTLIRRCLVETLPDSPLFRVR